MWRRNETGGWQSQTRFESRPGESKSQKGKRPDLRVGSWRRHWMWRRNETGGWQSQTRFESRPSASKPQKGRRPTCKQDRRLAQPESV